MFANVDGLLNKRDEISLRFCNSNVPEVLVLAEVIPKGQQNPIALSDIKLDRFQDPFVNFNLDSENPGKAGRGLAVYVRDDVENVTNLCIQTALIECICVSIQAKHYEKFAIVAIYRSPSLAGPESTKEVCDLMGKNE